jgi:hypothetical protein
MAEETAGRVNAQQERSLRNYGRLEYYGCCGCRTGSAFPREPLQ